MISLWSLLAAASVTLSSPNVDRIALFERIKANVEPFLETIDFNAKGIDGFHPLKENLFLISFNYGDTQNPDFKGKEFNYYDYNDALVLEDIRTCIDSGKPGMLHVIDDDSYRMVYGYYEDNGHVYLITNNGSGNTTSLLDFVTYSRGENCIGRKYEFSYKQGNDITSSTFDWNNSENYYVFADKSTNKLFNIVDESILSTCTTVDANTHIRSFN